jgi:hypothetical protein
MFLVMRGRRCRAIPEGLHFPGLLFVEKGVPKKTGQPTLETNRIVLI